MKFITTADDDGVEQVFVFPRAIHHDTMAEVLGHIKNQTHGNWHRVFRYPVAAGFVDAHGQCHGKSETLNLSARPQDTALLKAQMQGGVGPAPTSAGTVGTLRPALK